MFSLPGSPSAPSGKTPPLILLLLPLTDINTKELYMFVWGGDVNDCFSTGVYKYVIVAAL